MIGHSNQDDTLDATREKAIRLFQFVQAFNERRNPPVRTLRQHEWTLRFSEIPSHDSIKLLTAVDDAADEGETDEAVDPQGNERVILRCSRSDLSEPPSAPPEVDPWLDREWRNANADPKPIKSKNTVIGGETVVEKFTDSEARLNAFDEYQDLWLIWAEAERRALAAGDLFNKLFELYGRLERDAGAFELVLANGILSWQSNFEIYHPVLTTGLLLRFEPKVPEFVLYESGTGTEFYHALFSNIEGVSGALIGELRESVDELGLHPLGNSVTPGFLRSIPTRLSQDGRYVDEADPGKATPTPVLGRMPVILLRKRISGLPAAIAAVVQAIQNGGDIPQPLVNVVGIEAEARYASGREGASFSRNVDANADENILFTKPANVEQLMIARALEREDGVLVQGPPGTGKTHTIANLLGHLLAQGKTVLVTSQTPKALKVLKDKVTPELQSLCVSVIDSTDDDAALKASIDGIVERIGFSDEASLERAIDRFHLQRAALIKQLSALKDQLKTARLDEYLDIVVAGEPKHPSDAAKLVGAGVGIHDWIPGPLSLGASLPLSIGDVTRLYATNSEVSPEDELAIKSELPDITALAAPSEYTALVQAYRELEAVDRGRAKHLWGEPSPDHSDTDSLETLHTTVRDALKVFDGAPPWAMKLVEVGLASVDVALWESLISDVETFQAETAAVRRLLVSHEPQIAERLDELRAVAVYTNLAEEVGRTGKLPGFIALLTRQDWKIAIEESRVNGGASPRTSVHFQALAAKATLERRGSALARRWANQVVVIGGPALNENELGEAAVRYLPALRAWLGWADMNWLPIISQFHQCGLKWSGLLAESAYRHSGLNNIERINAVALELLPDVLAAEEQRRRWIAVNTSLAALRKHVAVWSRSGLPGTLVSAISQLDEMTYADAYAKMAHLRSLEANVHERRALLARLDLVAPGWADAIRNRVNVHAGHALRSDVQAAWRWRQYNDEIDRRSQLSLPDLVRRIDAVKSELNAVTIALVDRRAWLHQKQRMTLKERNALFGFAVARRQYGKGTGKRAALQLAEQRRLMSDARTAVPVWIMAIDKAVEVFKPETVPFDVVIIDEASQSDVTSLVALYLGRQVLVVGDDEQISPRDVGQSVDVQQQLIDAFLDGIPNRQQYTGQLSIYDVAKWSFGGAITLLEHFRSVPDIIRFSNELSYGGKIKPLREVTEALPTPSVVEFRVAGLRAGDVNEVEAKSIVALIKACTDQPAYAGKSIGIISLLADHQSRYIEQLLFRVLSPDEIAHRRITVGNAYQFQGDERDVMFLSIVNSSEGFLPMESTRQFQQRVNVAASRARDQMWVVHSLNPATNLKAGDLRRKLIEHAEDPKALVRAATAALVRSESPFEDEVIKRLSAAGYRLTSNHPVGSYRIDIVVHGAGATRLAIECDGARYHGPEELDYDMQRQADLERMGWRFERIRGTAFYRDRDAALAPVFERLSSIGIEPLVYDSGVVTPQASTELLNTVKARAQDILEEMERHLESGEMLLMGARGRSRRVVRIEAHESAADRVEVNGEQRDAGGIGGGQMKLTRAEDPNSFDRKPLDEYSTQDLKQLTVSLCSQRHYASAEQLARDVAVRLQCQRFVRNVRQRLMPLAETALREAS